MNPISEDTISLARSFQTYPKYFEFLSREGALKDICAEIKTGGFKSLKEFYKSTKKNG